LSLAPFTTLTVYSMYLISSLLTALHPYFFLFYFLMILPPPRSTLFPYTTLFRSKIRGLMVTVCPSQFATRRTLFHVLVGCGLLMLKVSRLKLPVIWLLVSMWLNTLTKSQIWTLLLKV